MNQILVTGDEQVRESNTKKEKLQKPKQVLPINGIVVFYAICIIILGICMISGSVYARTKINETVMAAKTPEITLERDDDNNTVIVSVSHVREIKNIIYSWNDEEEVMIDGRNRKNLSESIDLIGGENTLKIIVTEENGNSRTIEKTFIVGNIPEIKLESVENGVKIIATSEINIDFVQYSWDDGEMKKIEVGKEKYEGVINVPKGKHTLKVEVVDENNMIATEETEVIGDTEPTVNVQSKLVNGKATFVIDVEDDESIKTLTIIHNGGEKQIIEINEKTYHKEITMTEGEVNTLIVVATNLNDLQKTRKVKFENI